MWRMCCSAGWEREREGAVLPTQVFVPREDLSLDVIKQYRVVRARAPPDARAAAAHGLPASTPHAATPRRVAPGAAWTGRPRRNVLNAVAEGAVTLNSSHIPRLHLWGPCWGAADRAAVAARRTARSPRTRCGC